MLPLLNLITKRNYRLKWQMEHLMKKIKILSLKRTSRRWLGIHWLPHNVTSSKMNNVITYCQFSSKRNTAWVWVHEPLILLTHMRKVRFPLLMINLMVIKVESMLFQQDQMEGNRRDLQKSSLNLTVKFKINQQS